MATTDTTQRVTLETARAMTAAARRKAEETGVPVNIAFVDDGNNLVAFARMDQAWLGSIGIARGKAYTARAFDMPAKDRRTRRSRDSPGAASKPPARDGS